MSELAEISLDDKDEFKNRRCFFCDYKWVAACLSRIFNTTTHPCVDCAELYPWKTKNSYISTVLGEDGTT